MAVDPFSWAQQYSNNQEADARQENSDAQNALMSVFRAEAARQQPWSDLPVDLAKTNALYGNKLDNGLALASAKAQNKPAVAPAAIAAKIRRTAIAYGVDPDFALAVAAKESRFNQNATSSTGARGVFQLTKGASAEMGVNRDDLDQNIDGGIRYLKKMQDIVQNETGTIDPGRTYVYYNQGEGGGRTLYSGQRAGEMEMRVNGGRQNQQAGSFIKQLTGGLLADLQQRKALRSRGSATAALDPNQVLSAQQLASLQDEKPPVTDNNGPTY
jgi:soluble lytic murein transglycosylase-like protein